MQIYCVRSTHHRISRCAILASIAMVWANLAAIAGNLESTSARLLASNCSQCHGPSEGAPGFDMLLGKAPNKLYGKLKKYQSGAEGEGIMTRHALGYTDQQLHDLAEWLSKQR